MSLMLNQGSWQDPAPPCREVCQLARAQVLYSQAQRLAEQMGRDRDGRITMSKALWCDAGEHAFSARDPRREHWQRTVFDGEGGEVQIPWDVCGPHVQSGRMQAAVDAAEPAT
jgi:hypothetical protein